MRKILSLFIILITSSVEAKYIPHITVNPLPKKNQGLFMPSLVLTDQSLAKSQNTFVGNALNQTPGLTSLSSGTEGSVNTIKFRGANDGHTLVVIDGIPVNNPAFTTNHFDFGKYRAIDVKEISILPGSQSLLYGSNAIGGVVVIETLTGEGDPTAQVTQEVGTSHLVRTQAQTSGQIDKFTYVVSGEKYRIGEGAIWNARRQLRQSDDYHDYTGSVKLGVQAHPTLNLSGYFSSNQGEFKNNSYNSKNLPIESNIYKSKTKSQLGYLRLNWKPSEKFHHLLTVSNLRTSMESFDVGKKSKDVGSRNRLHHLFNYQISEKNLLQFAFEHEADGYERIHQEARHVYQKHFVGTYEFKPSDIVTLGFGVRETRHKTFKSHTTYQISGKLTFKTTEIFSSFGTGFRSPSLYQLYGNSAPTTKTLPNKDLKPEKSQSFDAGVEQLISSLKSKIRLSYFILHINNLIDYNRQVPRYENMDQRITYGLESKLKTDFTPDLNTQLSYTYTRGIDSNTRRHPMKVPQHKLGLSLHYCPHNWSNFVEGTLVSSIKDFGNTRVPTYFVLRLGSAYEVNDHIKIFGRVENLLGRVYEETFGYIARGRSVIGGLTLKL